MKAEKVTKLMATPFSSLRQKWLQVPVLLGARHRHGGHDTRIPAVGQRRRDDPAPGTPHAVSQQPLLRLPQVLKIANTNSSFFKYPAS